MSAAKDGGPAFPASEGEAHQIAYAEMMASGAATSEEKDAVYMAAKAAALRGMSLRDYFAAKAMLGEITHQGLEGREIDHIAGMAYEMANAMLRAREVQS